MLYVAPLQSLCASKITKQTKEASSKLKLKLKLNLCTSKHVHEGARSPV